MSEQQPAPKRGWKAWQIIGLVVVGLAVIGGVGSALGLGGKDEPADTVTTPSTATEPTPTVAPVEPEVSLAGTVWAQVLANFPGGITPDSPLFAVTGVEDVSNGTIRVNVQEQLTDTQREQVARHVTNLGSNPDLTAVVVRDVTGIDSNHYV